MQEVPERYPLLTCMMEKYKNKTKPKNPHQKFIILFMYPLGSLGQTI